MKARNLNITIAVGALVKAECLHIAVSYMALFDEV